MHEQNSNKAVLRKKQSSVLIKITLLKFRGVTKPFLNLSVSHHYLLAPTCRWQHTVEQFPHTFYNVWRWNCNSGATI